MKFVALLTEGADAIFNIVKAVQNGHELVALANLRYTEVANELNEYGYQAAGAETIELTAQALDKPLIRRDTKGKPVTIKNVAQTPEDIKDDEVEDLLQLLKEVKEKYPEVEAVAAGAFALTYRNLQVENVAKKLGLTPLVNLWDKKQIPLLQDILTNELRVLVYKTAAPGLDPRFHLGKTVEELYNHFLQITNRFGYNPVGERGEYEGLVLDAPIFKRRLEVRDYELVIVKDDPIRPVGYLRFKQVDVVEKKENEGKIRAIGVDKPGPAETLKEVVFDRRPLGTRDLVVKVYAVSVNPVDYKKRRSGFMEPPQINEKNPLINGYDAAGEVIAVGAHVQYFKVGDQVYYSGDLARKGANAKEHIVDERCVALKPKNLTYAEAASIPLVFGTAWEALYDMMRLRIDPKENENKDILIVAGAGGVGSAAIQLAKRVLGLRVIATASRQDSEDYCKKMGADIVINHRNPLKDELKKHGIETVPYILNCYDTTVDYFNQFVGIIQPFGQFVGMTGFDDPINLMPLFAKRVHVSIVFMALRPVYQVDLERQREYFGRFTQWLEEKVLVPTNTITEQFNVENLIKGHQAVESGTMLGKFVLDGIEKW